MERINIGTNPTGVDGDTNRQAWEKANANFEEVGSISRAVGGIFDLDPAVPFAAGIVVNSTRVAVEQDGKVYAPLRSAVPFTTAATFDAAQWRPVQGVTEADLAAPGGAGKVVFTQEGLGSVPRPTAHKLADNLSLKDKGAVGDGVTDDSAAFLAFVQDCMARGITGEIPSGRYLIPNVPQITVTGALSLIGTGPERPVLVGGTASPAQQFCLADKSLRFRSIGFEDFKDVVSAGDGSGGAIPSTLTGDVDTLSFADTTFNRCRRAAFCVASKTGPELLNLEIMGCIFDGAKVARAGFYIAWTNIRDVTVRGNKVRGINATSAGYTTAGGPQNVGNGRGILVGGNNPELGYATSQWVVYDNEVEDIEDSRNQAAGINPEVGGLRVTGAKRIAVALNRISNIRSTGVGVSDDCEGLYIKAAHSVVALNTLLNAGENGGAMLVKGYNRVRTDYDPVNPSADGFAGVLSQNVIVRNDGRRSNGIGIYSSDWIVENNYVEGCGGDTTRYAPIWINADQDDNVSVRGNTVKDAIGLYGILGTCYGTNLRIENNTIDGVLASYSGLTASNTYGVMILNGNSNGFNTTGVPLSNPRITGNNIGRIATMPGMQSRAITVNSSGSPTTGLRITDNVLATAVSVGIQLQQGQFNGVTITGNDLTLADTKYSVAGSPTITEMTAHSNRGWLCGQLVVDLPSVASLATIVVGTVNLAGAASRDTVSVTSSAGLQGMILWARVSATGVVTIYAFNPTEASINMSTSTFRVKVEKFAVE